MSSRKERDIIDYIDDKTHNEDLTPFIPVRADGGPDGWSAFFGGILIGISGGALVAVSPWLGGTLIAAGYGLTAYSLSGLRNRSRRSLCFGFAACALGGLVIVIGAGFSPETTWSAVTVAGKRKLIFLGTFALPWVISLVRYFYALRRPRPL